MTTLPRGAASRMFHQLVPGTPLRVAPPPRSHLLWWPALCAALLVSGVLWLTASPPLPPGVFYDDGIYLGLARALVHWDGYRHLALPGHPLGIHYPPGYPLWLAVWGIGHWGAPLPALTAWMLRGNALLTVLAAALWVRWGTRVLHLPPGVAILAGVGAVLCVPARAVVTVAFSEPLGWAALAGVALSVHRLRWRTPAIGGGRVVMAAALLGFLPLVRSALTPFLVGALLILVSDRVARWRLAVGAGDEGAARSRETARVCLLAVLLLAPALAWATWTHVHAGDMPAPWRGNYGTYAALWRGGLHSLGDVLHLATRQGRDGWRIARVLLGGPTGAASGIIALLVGAGVAIRVAPALVLGLGGYGLLIALWPVEPDRFVWGVLPLLAVLMARGMVSLFHGATRARPSAPAYARAWGDALRRSACTLAAAGGLAGSIAFVSWNLPGYRAQPRGWRGAGEAEARSYAPVVRWVVRHQPSGVLASPNDALLAVMTGREVIPALPADPGSVSGTHAVPEAVRMRASLCTVPEGWLLLPVLGDGAAHAAVDLARDPGTSGIDLAVLDRIGPSGLAIRYHCRTQSGTP